MKFHPTQLAGAYLLDPERREDERGFFARTYCAHEFAAHGLVPCVAQCNLSHNRRAGTVRGMHFQTEPFPEAKLVRVTRGAIVDVIVDLRRDSPTHRQHLSVELTEENGRALYIPAGFAHGFQTLRDGTEVFYQMSEFFHGECASGVRWNDPAFSIAWPLPIACIADKDLQFSDYSV
jgi:dTDP-4-dehydrorhamnose 3,5-epimerase